MALALKLERPPGHRARRRFWVLFACLVLIGCQPGRADHRNDQQADRPDHPPSTRAISTTPSRPPPDGFPGPSNTGVPSGVKLTPYKGPSTITKCGTVIDAKLITGDLTISVGNGTTSASTPCVTVKNSRINGVVNTGNVPGRFGPLVLTDDEIDAPTNSTLQAVFATNFYLWRVNLHGGANGGIDCAGYCAIHDSWTHDFYNAGVTHYDGIISNGTGGHPMIVDHNTISCGFYAAAPNANGGCSADLGLFGDFSPISHVTVTGNLFVATTVAAGATGPSFCAYGGSEDQKSFPKADHVVFSNNTFQHGSAGGKCGQYGPIADFQSGRGNRWSGNVWDDGGAVFP